MWYVLFFQYQNVCKAQMLVLQTAQIRWCITLLHAILIGKMFRRFLSLPTVLSPTSSFLDTKGPEDATWLSKLS